MEIAISVNSVPVRLTSERWVHIVENHDELAGRFHEVLETVSDPDLLLKGKKEELLAVRAGKKFSLVVIYKEVSEKDGFIITAFQITKLSQLLKSRKILWQKE